MVVRLVVCWPVSWEVVVAVDIGTCELLGECVEAPAAKTADRLLAARTGLSSRSDYERRSRLLSAANTP